MQSKDYQSLRECPFCGGEAMYVELYANTKLGESSGYVRCARPIPCVAQQNLRAKNTCYKKWNRRRVGEGEKE